jgi:serine/threonine protein kinase
MSDTLASTKTLPQPAQAAGRLALPGPLEHDALVPGTRLDEFEIVRVLGAGGFGIVYLALDHVLERQVAIKEYRPSALAGRSDGAAVAMRSPAAVYDEIQATTSSGTAQHVARTRSYL